MLLKRGVFVLLTVFILSVSCAGFAQEEKENTASENPVRVVSGVGFSVPADWPIERRNGATGPIPIEEYMSLKFNKLEERISALEKKLDEKKADEEKSSKPEKNRLQSYEIQPSTQGG